MDYFPQIATAFGLVNQESFRHFLSENDVNRLQGTVSASLNLEDPRPLLKVLHPSWLKEQVARCSENQRAFFDRIEEKIYKPGALPEGLRILFLQNIFLSSEAQVIPDRKKAETSRLALLLGRPKEFLELVFQCIGCHFLAMSLRKVIAKKELENTVQALHPDARRYIRKLLFTSKKLPVEPLEVKLSECLPEELQALLKSRGFGVFQQLVKAQSPEFSWYFLRQLDVEFARMFEASENAKPIASGSIEKWTDAVCAIVRYLDEMGAS